MGGNWASLIFPHGREGGREAGTEKQTEGGIENSAVGGIMKSCLGFGDLALIFLNYRKVK